MTTRAARSNRRSNFLKKPYVEGSILSAAIPARAPVPCQLPQKPPANDRPVLKKRPTPLPQLNWHKLILAVRQAITFHSFLLAQQRAFSSLFLWPFFSRAGNATQRAQCAKDAPSICYILNFQAKVSAGPERANRRKELFCHFSNPLIPAPEPMG